MIWVLYSSALNLSLNTELSPEPLILPFYPHTKISGVGDLLKTQPEIRSRAINITLTKRKILNKNLAQRCRKVKNFFA